LITFAFLTWSVRFNARQAVTLVPAGSGNAAGQEKSDRSPSGTNLMISLWVASISISKILFFQNDELALFILATLDDLLPGTSFRHLRNACS
jgi:hypothetical protein